MYIFKSAKKDEIENITIASEIIGISRTYLTNILNRKNDCSKVVAYAITKYINKEAEIKDYFVKGE